jgi:aspartyl-tRNA synthetase
MRPTDRPDLTLSFDLLWKGLEITTGAQREHRYEVLLRQADERGLDPEPMSECLNCFRYGCPPHGGLGPSRTPSTLSTVGANSSRRVSPTAPICPENPTYLAFIKLSRRNRI